MERHLREAYLRDDSDRVAFWTDAIECWAKPIPDYARSELNQFSLKERVSASTSEAARNRDIGGSAFAPKRSRS
jgi:hypothetical protein